jgi:hypothetical protein
MTAWSKMSGTTHFVVESYTGMKILGRCYFSKSTPGLFESWEYVLKTTDFYGVRFLWSCRAPTVYGGPCALAFALWTLPL